MTKKLYLISFRPSLQTDDEVGIIERLENWLENQWRRVIPYRVQRTVKSEETTDVSIASVMFSKGLVLFLFAPDLSESLYRCRGCMPCRSAWKSVYEEIESFFLSPLFLSDFSWRENREKRGLCVKRLSLSLSCVCVTQGWTANDLRISCQIFHLLALGDHSLWDELLPENVFFPFFFFPEALMILLLESRSSSSSTWLFLFLFLRHPSSSWLLFQVLSLLSWFAVCCLLSYLPFLLRRQEGYDVETCFTFSL